MLKEPKNFTANLKRVDVKWKKIIRSMFHLSKTIYKEYMRFFKAPDRFINRLRNKLLMDNPDFTNDGLYQAIGILARMIYNGKFEKTMKSATCLTPTQKEMVLKSGLCFREKTHLLSK
jgi:hypothetical protein